MLFLVIVLLSYSCNGIPVSVYENAQFVPIDWHFFLKNISEITSQEECSCQCFSDPMCLTATYIGINQQCSLFFARLWEGILQVATTDKNSSVLVFTNATLPPPSLLTNTNENVLGIWNTTAGSNSVLATEGFGLVMGNYYAGEIPSYVFDRLSSTKYTALGTCLLQIPNMSCGVNTGLYLTLSRGASLLVALRLCTAPDIRDRDPLTITVEGSQQVPAQLSYGSSWTLIYNGSSGLDSDPGRSACGITQAFPNNSIWYSSYRLLITLKVGYDYAVQVGELELLGY